MHDLHPSPESTPARSDEARDGEEIELWVVLPFMGPGVDPRTGKLRASVPDTVVLHSTQLQLIADPAAAQRFG